MDSSNLTQEIINTANSKKLLSNVERHKESLTRNTKLIV